MVSFRSISWKIWLCVGIAFCGFLIATLFTFVANLSLSGRLTTLKDVEFPLALYGNEVVSQFKKQSKYFEEAFLLGDQEALKNGQELTPVITGLLEEMISLHGESQMEVSASLRKLAAQYAKYGKEAGDVYQGAIGGGADLANLQERVQGVGRIQGELLKSFEELAQALVVEVQRHFEQEKNTAKANTYILLALFVAVLIISYVVIRIVADKVLVKPIGQIQGMVKALGEGDVSSDNRIATRANDEIGDLARELNAMTANLGGMIQNIEDAAGRLAGISVAIHSASKRVVDAAQLQAGGVNETSSAITQISQSIGNVSQSVDLLSSSAAENTSSILEMAASIEEVALNMETLKRTVENVSSAILEMTASIREVSVNASTLEQSASVTASSVTQMDLSIRQVEQSAAVAAKIAEEVRSDAETGKAAVEATISGMQQIRQASAMSSEVMTALSSRVENIGSILGVIDDVVSEINLLALNAAIIAAQAGIHGRGFSVVADEIKELAERTGVSTREITQVISGIQDESRRAVEAIAKAGDSIATGERLSQQSGEALTKIVQGAQQTSQQMEEIVRATREQRGGSHMIQGAMQEVADMTRQIAMATQQQEKGGEQIATAAEKMRELSGQVQSSTRQQSNASSAIARSTEEMTTLVGQIKRACDEQNKGSGQILQAVNNISGSTTVNLEAVKVMDSAVENLTEQVETLRKEMSAFKVSREECQ